MLGPTFQVMIAATALSVAVAAQPTRSVGPALDLRSLERLDETRQDTGPLRTSLLQQSIDLRQPSGFDQVYRLPNANGTERLARINGGLAAVFPRSTYVTTGRGEFALVPPGTVFYIGAIPTEAIAVRPAAESMADTRTYSQAGASSELERVAIIDTRVPETRQVAPASRDMNHRPPESIMTDETYRAARVRSLLQIAATGSQPLR